MEVGVLARCEQHFDRNAGRYFGGALTAIFLTVLPYLIMIAINYHHADYIQNLENILADYRIALAAVGTVFGFVALIAAKKILSYYMKGNHSLLITADQEFQNADNHFTDPRRPSIDREPIEVLYELSILSF